MANPDSKVFKMARAVGVIMGKGIYYILMAGIIFVVGKKLPKKLPKPERPAQTDLPPSQL